MEDNRLIQEMKKGDSEAFGVLFDKYYDKVYRYCYRRLTDREFAEDMTQEVFLRVLKSIGSYRHYGKFENYLYVIAKNLIKDSYGKREILPIEDVECAVEETGFDGIEKYILLSKALAKIPEREREILLLRYDADLKIKDIARVMGMNLSTTKYHLKKGIQMLKELIAEDYYT